MQFTVRLPSGRPIQVEADPDASDEEIMARASQQASSTASAPVFDPAIGASAEFNSMPAWQQAQVGIGSGLNDLRLSAKQLLGNVGIGDDAAVQSEIDDNAKYAGATWGSPAGFMGNMVGMVAPFAAIPGGALAGGAGRALTLAGRAGRAARSMAPAVAVPGQVALGTKVAGSMAIDGALQGALGGLMMPTETGQSTVGQILGGAGGGAVVGKGLGMLATRMNASKAAPGITDTELGLDDIAREYGPDVAERLRAARALPRPIALDAGQATGDEALQNTISASRHMIGGRGLQNSWNVQDELLRDNLDELITRTGGVGEYGVSPANAGASISGWYNRASGIAKKRAKLLFQLADRKEGLTPAENLNPLLSHLYENSWKAADANSSMPGIFSLLKGFGIEVGEDGIPRAGDRVITLRDLNSVRQKLSELSAGGGTAGRDAGEVMRAVNDTMLANRGTLYPRAVKAWRNWAQEFANDEAGRVKSALSEGATGPTNFADERLLDTILSKSVAVRDLESLRASMLKPSRRTGQISGAGQTAWRNLQADMLDFIKQKATFGGRESTELSARKLEAAIQSIGVDKVKAILGNDLSGLLQAVSDTANVVKNVSHQPGTAPALLNMASGIPYVGTLASGAGKGLPIARAMMASRRYGPQFVEKTGAAQRRLIAEELGRQSLMGTRFGTLPVGTRLGGVMGSEGLE